MNKLSAFHKKIITQLINKEINDSKSFFNNNFSKININSTHEEIKEAYDNIIEYLILMNSLKKKDLIYIEDKLYDGTNIIKDTFFVCEFGEELTVINKSTRYYLKGIETLINKNKDYDIYATPELSKFVKYKYKTEDERLKLFAIWLPIIVAGITIIFGAIVNYIIYSNQREVIIKNPNDFNNTYKVIIIDTSKREGVTDSSKK